MSLLKLAQNCRFLCEFPYFALLQLPAYGNLMRMAVSDERLRHARDVAAEIVATHDPKYAPIFKVLDDELKKRERIAAVVQSALREAAPLRLRERRRKQQRSRPAPGAQSS
nr:hypothetical protein [Hyphomonas sp. 34-62-18]